MNPIFKGKTLGYLLSNASAARGNVLQYEVPKLTIIPCRTKYENTKHWDQKWRTARSRKVWKVDLPDFDKARQGNKNMTPEEVRSKFKEKGVAPPNPYEEREIFSPCTLALIDAYQPPPGDGKSSSLIDKVKLPVVAGADFVKWRRHVNVIKSFEGEEFNVDSFTKQTTDIYIKAHEALANKDDKSIFQYVTEHCFPVMAAGLNRHTIIWKYLGDVEPPQAVQVRAADMIGKGNKFAQITVRMHTKQILAVYDRHGRLAYGSPTDVKEVLEYIVFEKYLANEYGTWRVHERIRPQGTSTPISQIVPKTYVNAQAAN